MNKVICLCAAAAMLLASCSNDETVKIAEQNAISFRPVVGLNTKGLETTTNNLQTIKVTAYLGAAKQWENKAFEKGTSNFFESLQKYYWPANDDALTFTAFSDNWGITPTFTSNSDIKVTDVTVEDNVADQKDMVYVTGVTGKKSTHETTGVELNLEHALSQIQINAKNENSLYKYQVKGIRIAKAGNKSTFDVINGTWGNASDVKTYEITYEQPVTLDNNEKSIMGSAGNAMLIPQTVGKWNGQKIDADVDGAYISVLLNITTDAGALVYPKKTGGFAWASVPVKFEWEKGKKYIYMLNFTNGAGKVDPVDPGQDWDKDEPQKDPDKGKDILGEPIKFTVIVNNWDGQQIDLPMDQN